MFIGIAGWMILGLMVGFIASKVANTRDDDPAISIGLSAVTAVAAGFLYALIGRVNISPFNLGSLLVAGVAALMAVVSWHSWRRRGARLDARRTW